MGELGHIRSFVLNVVQSVQPRCSLLLEMSHCQCTRLRRLVMQEEPESLPTTIAFSSSPALCLSLLGIWFGSVVIVPGRLPLPQTETIPSLSPPPQAGTVLC